MKMAFNLVHVKNKAHMCYAQGRSQKWPKEGVLRPEIVKGGGFEGAEALRICARTSFCSHLGKNYQKIGPMGGPVLTPISPPLGYAPALISYNSTPY